MHPETLSTADESGVFTEALALYRRVEPSPLGADWWRGTCEVVDVTSCRLQNLWLMFGLVKRLESATGASWWSELLDHAVSLCKMSFRNNVGVNVHLENKEFAERLFNENLSILLEVQSDDAKAVQKILEKKHIPFDIIGSTCSEKTITINDKVNLSINEANNIWGNSLRGKLLS